jgi:hypothetical protein
MTQVEIEAIAELRLAELEAMADPDNYHPLRGNGFWLVSDDELASTIEGGEIHSEDDIGPVTIMYGWLSKQHDELCFSCVKVNGEGPGRRHYLTVPGRHD